MTKDAELRFTPGKGTAATSFTMAIDDGFGENKRTYYIPVVCWGKVAENVANYTKKGSLVGVSGKISTRTYDNKDGKKVYVVEVTANEVKFLDSKGTGQAQNNNSASGNDYFNTGIHEEDITPTDDGDCPF